MDNNPTILGTEDTAVVVFPDSNQITLDNTLEEVQKADLEIINAVVDSTRMAWGNVRSIGTLMGLAKTTIEVIKARRDIMGLEYGHQASKSKTVGLGKQFFSNLE